MSHYEVCHCSGPYPETISEHRSLAGAQKAFHARNRWLFDEDYAKRMGMKNAGTFDKIFYVNEDGEREEVFYDDED
jgi:hypothetical protein